jgi:toxin-antitoxin system PIN domain toxin
VILVDANLLIYAQISSSTDHEQARAWLSARLGSGLRVGIPWASILAYLRITTNPRVYARPLTITAAWEDVGSWLEQPGTWIPDPTEQHATVLQRLLLGGAVHGNLVTDAHLAALAIEHGLTLMTADRGFARFPGLRFENPVART